MGAGPCRPADGCLCDKTPTKGGSLVQSYSSGERSGSPCGADRSSVDSPAFVGRHWSGSVLDVVQGSWKRQGDDAIMGQIKGDRIHWDESFHHAPCLLMSLQTGELDMQLGDAHYKASLKDQKLHWSDGEVWVRYA
mmetsp:Transcript_132721/g.383729  ORF Transcript_132721/g.383729 Transcript_132721/m.383729 type:complete len:136 (+) Transcript_132721:93-500(+)